MLSENKKKLSIFEKRKSTDIVLQPSPVPKMIKFTISKRIRSRNEQIDNLKTTAILHKNFLNFEKMTKNLKSKKQIKIKTESPNLETTNEENPKYKFRTVHDLKRKINF